MARKKVINKGQNQDLIGGNFTNDATRTVFTLGDFVVESNFTGRKTRDYSTELSSFVTPITLETLGITNEESTTLSVKYDEVELNLDNSDLKTFITYGSSREFIRVSLENIISKYPASLYVSSQVDIGGNITFENLTYDSLTDKASFKIPSQYIINKFGLIFDDGNTSVDDDNTLGNLNLSFGKYVIWNPNNNISVANNIIGFTGDTSTDAYVYIETQGNPFPDITGTTGTTRFHIKPQIIEWNKIYSKLSTFEKYILENRVTGNTGFEFEFKNPILQENGEILYKTQKFKWRTTDGYNIDISGERFTALYTALLTIGDLYDDVKTDLVARFLTPASLKVYDTTQEGKITKLLRLYGAEFDKIKQFINSLVNINKVSYDKKNNVPDTFVKNLARTLGWDVFTLTSERELVESFFSTTQEQGKNDLLPAEIDIELWRRILINTAYFWKTKGTRDAIKSIFLLIGIPEPFINITEYVYTAEGKINPNEVQLSLEDLPSASLPYNSAGYPIAPVETNDFYFQIGGDSDSGQAYINNFRNVGFRLNRTQDNKKSWVYDGEVERIHYSTPNYFQEASELVINTKEVDVTLDLARAIEYDVYLYNRDVDDPLTSTGFTNPYIFINVPFDYGTDTNVFTIPDVPLTGSSIQVSFNGVTLTPTGSSTGDTGGDYYVSGPQEITLTEETARVYSNGNKDLITITYLYDRLGGTGYTNVQYLVQTPVVGVGGTSLTLPQEPKGDVQLIIDGITMTKGTSLFTGDFIIDENDRTKIIVQNTALQQYLQQNPVIRLWYIVDDGVTSNAEVKSEAHRVDSLSSAKLFYNAGIDKFVYVLNITAYDVESIKITVNGLTLQNGKDFTLNPANKKQVYLTNNPIRLGDVIGAYYVIADPNSTSPLLPSIFPDIQGLSFLEYLELIQRNLINARTRKTISNFNGGYYPTVLEVFDTYIRRSKLDSSDPLLSNGYTFTNLYPFINQYNAFFSRFINQLLPSTIILRKGGILIRNTSFTKQKFMYRRGVNFNSDLQWLGDDGAEYIRTLTTKICEWTEDSVCVDAISQCISFFTQNTSNVEDPQASTTSTTAPPSSEYTLFAVGGDASGSEIYKSTNSGENWTAKYNGSSGAQLYNIKFFNSNTGVAVGFNGTGWRTTNGGESWTMFSNPLDGVSNTFNGYTIRSIDSVGTVGFVGSAWDRFFKTTDSGSVWTDTPATGGLPHYSYGLKMLDEDTVVSVSTSDDYRITRTDNGGDNFGDWDDVDAGVDVSFGNGSLRTIDFSPSSNAIGLTTGLDQSGRVYRTTDSGQTWSLYSNIPTTDGVPTIHDIKYASNTHVYALGRRNGQISGETVVLFFSSNGGLTWTNISESLDEVGLINGNNAGLADNQAFSMVWSPDYIEDTISGEVGWILHEDGRVFKTSNGGQTWAVISSMQGNLTGYRIIVV